MDKINILKSLCSLNGLSGDESDVRDFIISQISGFCTFETDKLGNIIAFKRGAKKADKKIMLEAHMDETGYIVTNIDENGYIRFGSVGVSANVTVGKHVKIKSREKNIDGVIGITPVHKIKKDDRLKVPSVSEMYIDIGAKSKKEAEKYVFYGDSIYFESEFSEFGKYIKGKALDDRIGCYNLIRLIQSEIEYDTYYAFCVQEEVGLVGAGVAANRIQPDYAVILEGTTAADIAGVEDSKHVCRLGGGVCISFADKGTLYPPDCVKLCSEAAEENNISYQFKEFVSGGCDAGSIQRAGKGAKVVTLSAPVRYLHSRISVASYNDIEDMFNLASVLINKINLI